MVKTTILFICDHLLGALIHFNFIILILICFLLMMPGVNFVIHGSSSARTTVGVSLYRSLTMEEHFIAVITQDRVINDNLKKKIKTKLCARVDYSYLPTFFNILGIGQKYFSFYPPSLFNMHR